jgi:Predicted membrane protein (DUF2231)
VTDALFKPFYEFVTAPPRQWHPVIVHFPIVFLIAEAVLLGLWRVTAKPGHEPLAYGFLQASLWTMLMVAIAGVHDAGLDLGAGNPLWLGLQDRWRQGFRWRSSITVHSWLALALLAITAARLLWRKIGGPYVLRGGQGWAYGLITLIGLWILTAAGYVGGMITHK